MEPALFEIRNNRAYPTEHCYTIASLRNVIDEFGEENAGKIFTLCHYMHSLNEKRNPFANLPQDQKEEVIIREVCPELDTDHIVVREAIEFVGKVYDTTVHRLFEGWKVNLDRLGEKLKNTEWVLGKDGNASDLISLSKNYPALRASYKQAYQEYQEEQGNAALGGTELAYDEDDLDEDE